MTEILISENAELNADVVKETARLIKKYQHSINHLSGFEKTKKVWQLEYDAVIDLDHNSITFLDDKKYSLWLLRVD